MSLFPYSTVREIQRELVQDVESCLKNKKNLIVHAPTGLGKTAATLAPALEYALDNDKTVLFLTSRHTQHKIAIETLQEIRDKFNLKFTVVDMIGKKWMCAQPGANMLHNNEFTEFCNKQVEESKCEYYNNTKTKGKLSVTAQNTIEEIKNLGPVHTDKLFEVSAQNTLCPYEISASLASEAVVIVTDYYYMFHPSIRDFFLKRIGKELKDCIIIIDEAHNLGERIRSISMQRLSNLIIKRAVKEANKYSYDEIVSSLIEIRNIFNEYASRIRNGEILISKDDFISRINKIKNYEELVKDLKFIGDAIREEEKQSFVGSIGNFLEGWQATDESFSKIFSVKDGRDPIMTLFYRCLDPSLIAKEVVNTAHCTIAMSGTLTPTDMYRDLLGFKNSIEKEFGSPFPEENKLSLVIPETTTKFDLRNEKQFKEIADICAGITNIVPGNSAIFFPSYYLRDKVFNYYAILGDKTIFKEDPKLTKSERFEMIENFKEYKKIGAVLLGAASGSFGEGIDLPGDLLKCVVIVGLPLTRPDLETQELIKYYDRKFGKGWDYGYVFPAFNKVLQSAGRCIRSETDKGVVVFLDARYTWPNYKRCFPKDSGLKISRDYKEEIKEFFAD